MTPVDTTFLFIFYLLSFFNSKRQLTHTLAVPNITDTHYKLAGKTREANVCEKVRKTQEKSSRESFLFALGSA